MTTHSTDPLDPVLTPDESFADPAIDATSVDATYTTSSYDEGSADSTSTTDTAKDEAKNVTNAATDATSQVADTAKQQASQVASDVRDQTRQLADQTRTQLSDQVVTQRDKAVGGLRSLGDELRGLTSDDSDSKPAPGLATQFAKEGADLTHKIADFIEQREPAELLDEVRSFARRKPGAFLLGAAVAGVVVGRLTRGAIAARQSDEDSTSSPSGAPVASDNGYGTATPSYGTAQMDALAYPADASAPDSFEVGAESTTAYPTDQGYRS